MGTLDERVTTLEATRRNRPGMMSRLQSLQVGTLLAVIAALAGMLSGLPR